MVVGRKKRKRKPGAGSGVKVKPYIRSPRGPDTKNGKPKRPVKVDSYQRGKPKSTKAAPQKKKKRRRRRRG